MPKKINLQLVISQEQFQAYVTDRLARQEAKLDTIFFGLSALCQVITDSEEAIKEFNDELFEFHENRTLKEFAKLSEKYGIPMPPPDEKELRERPF